MRRKQWHPTPVLLPGESHGRGSLVGCSPWGRWKSDTTEQLHFHCSLSCMGEGNGNPIQCSCLENPRDGGAWWAAIYGVTESRTRLKCLSSSSRTQRHKKAPKTCNLDPNVSHHGCISNVLSQLTLMVVGVRVLYSQLPRGEGSCCLVYECVGSICGCK